jgi:hypothetical protein
MADLDLSRLIDDVMGQLRQRRVGSNELLSDEEYEKRKKAYSDFINQNAKDANLAFQERSGTTPELNLQRMKETGATERQNLANEGQANVEDIRGRWGVDTENIKSQGLRDVANISNQAWRDVTKMHGDYGIGVTQPKLRPWGEQAADELIKSGAMTPETFQPWKSVLGLNTGEEPSTDKASAIGRTAVGAVGESKSDSSSILSPSDHARKLRTIFGPSDKSSMTFDTGSSLTSNRDKRKEMFDPFYGTKWGIK